MSKGQIFLDTQRISSRGGQVAQRFYAARKHPEPVLRGDTDWERAGASIYGTVLYDGSRFRMWYLGRDPFGNGDTGWICYAESSDGLDWEKPELGIVEINGSRRNNVTNLTMDGASIVYHPEDPDPERHYKALGWVENPATNQKWGTNRPRTAYYTAHSADGWHWTNDPSGPQIDLAHDEARMVWDRPRGRFLASVKNNHPYGFHQRRSVTICTSFDAVDWSAPRMALVPDELDDLHAQAAGFTAADYYGLALYPRDELVIGLLWIHQMWPPFHRVRTSGMFSRVHIRLAYSQDGIVWQHPPGRPTFLDVGERGAFDAGSVYTADTPVEVGDEVWFYYTGASKLHGFTLDPETWQVQPRDLESTEELAIGLATIKRDRFASLSCDGHGTFVVQHGTPGGTRLHVNARTGHGRVAAQVERPDGTLVLGFGLSDCRPFTGDSVSAEITWNGASLADLAPDAEIALRFDLDDADLFAYRLE